MTKKETIKIGFFKKVNHKKFGNKIKGQKERKHRVCPKEKSEEKRVVIVKQNGFNINVTFLDNDIRF